MASLREYNHVDLLFPGRFLKAADLRGRDVTVVIERIDPREELQMRGKTAEFKPVVYMKGKEKAWVLNKTNAMSIAKIYGPEVMSWIGKSVTIYPTRVQCGGKEVDAIRVRERAPKQADKAPPVAEEPWAVDLPHDADTGEVYDGTSDDELRQ